jgi:SAM-dependent methyltransferase
MPDVYSVVTEAAPDAVDRLGDDLELRASEPQQRAMLTEYLSRAALPEQSRVLEIGTGTGAVARVLASLPGVREVVATDPSAGLLARAGELSAGVSGLSFREADGRDLPFAAGEFDAVVAHTVLSHVPAPDRVLAEAFRVLRPGGTFAVFDGDYATLTLEQSPGDPLQACARAFLPAFVHDPWLMRRLPVLLDAAGFTGHDVHSHGYVQVTEPRYMLSVVDRGADALVAGGVIGDGLAAAFKAEARRRAEAGRFFGQVSYLSVVTRTPRP